MTCDELRPDYLLYALGVLEEPERSEVRAHLDRGCETCAAGLREARALAFAMGAAVDGPEPDASIAQPDSGGRRRSSAKGGGTGSPHWVARGRHGLGRLPALMLYQAHNYRSELAEARIEIERSGADAAAMRQAFDLIQAPETREVTFGQGQPAPPRGRVFFHPSGVLLVASRLPAPPPGKTLRNVDHSRRQAGARRSVQLQPAGQCHAPLSSALATGRERRGSRHSRSRRRRRSTHIHAHHRRLLL